ncbi:carbonic anhydrase [Helicobacter typhlonius]|uniref:carbonic anhydrase n=1 Tax=Helicobacter typhlonius TaxID=76936 RepID=UPI002FE18A54
MLKFYVAICLLCVGLWASEASGVHWGYDGENGPKNWGDLDKQFVLCKTGKAQTPVDIIPSQTKKTKQNIVFAYDEKTQNITNNGHSVQIDLKDSTSSLRFHNTTYELMQFHFHTPSENHINGVTYPLEVHFVHKNAKGELLVVGVLYKEGAENKVFDKIIKNLPKDVNNSKKFQNFDFLSLFAENKGYYEFIGSLTTPPCSENVQWVVMKTQPEVSSKQIKSLESVLHHNARDIQPLNKRVVKSTEE